MNKEKIVKILNATLLSYEGMEEQELIELFDVEPAKAGIKLAKYLRGLE